jgi:hypothetical protein
MGPDVMGAADVIAGGAAIGVETGGAPGLHAVDINKKATFT